MVPTICEWHNANRLKPGHEQVVLVVCAGRIDVGYYDRRGCQWFLGYPDQNRENGPAPVIAWALRPALPGEKLAL